MEDDFTEAPKPNDDCPTTDLLRRSETGEPIGDFSDWLINGVDEEGLGVIPTFVIFDNEIIPREAEENGVLFMAAIGDSLDPFDDPVLLLLREEEEGVEYRVEKTTYGSVFADGWDQDFWGGIFDTKEEAHRHFSWLLEAMLTENGSFLDSIEETFDESWDFDMDF